MIPNETDAELVRHMLGVGSHIPKRQWGYRNYFAAGSEGADREGMERLVVSGHVERGGTRGDHTYFRATEAGMDAIGLKPAQKKQAMGGGK